jgi:hypothetical protein
MTKQRRDRRKNTIWCNAWIYGGSFYYGFCPSEKAWNETMKRLGRVHKYPTTPGNATILTQDGTVTVVVTIGETQDKSDGVNVSSIVLHEAVHVWQELCKKIGESIPSAEFEAYTIQHIYGQLIGAYRETRGEVFKRVA